MGTGHKHTESFLDVAVYRELPGSQPAHHEETRGETGKGTAYAKLAGNLGETGDGALTGQSLGLVDLGKHRIGRLRHDGGSKASD